MRLMVLLAGISLAATAAVAASPLGTPVSGARARAIMHERHEGMEAVGKSLKEIARELRGGSPNLAVVRASANRMANLSKRSAGWFRPGTGPNIGKTGAKAEIWQQPEDFAAKQRAFQQSAQAFNAAARSGDLTAVNARLGELDRTCKACHDDYRTKMKH